MIFNNNQIFAKVWKSTVEEKYIDLQISTSEKDGDGNYKNSSWFPRVIGHAYNTLKDVKEGDRITITKSKFTNERYEDKDGNKRSFFRFIILEATINNDDASQEEENEPPKKKTYTAKKSSAPAQKEQDDDCPW